MTATDDSERPPEFAEELFPTIAWKSQARENIEKWGNQTPTVLLLALCEEVAEVADELLATAEKSYEADMVGEQAFSYLSEVRRAGFRCRTLLETMYEDRDGNPLPDDEVPRIVHDLDEDRVLDEVNDAAPLLFQLAWALKGQSQSTGNERDGGDAR